MAASPYQELQGHWEQYCARMKSADHEMHRSFQYESDMLRTWKADDAQALAREARMKWQMHVRLLLGNVSIEMQANGDCIVNHVMYFAKPR